MKLTFDVKLSEGYKSQSQKTRVLTEAWVYKSIFCPSCGHIDLEKYPHNKPVGDFYCGSCYEDYELKSKRSEFGNKIVDGAYSTMIERLTSASNPNFFLLKYNLANFAVTDFLVIPKHFFVSNIVEKRKPLSQTAERRNWVGCNILLDSIPQTGKIFFIRNRQIEPKEKVLEGWKKTLFLREEKEASAKGWLLDIMRCLEKLDKKEFKLHDVYAFEKELSRLHPENKHIKDKIRQQLQILRDKNYLEFLGRGIYSIR